MRAPLRLMLDSVGKFTGVQGQSGGYLKARHQPSASCHRCYTRLMPKDRYSVREIERVGVWVLTRWLIELSWSILQLMFYPSWSESSSMWSIGYFICVYF